MGIEINPEKCNLCNVCVEICPEDVLKNENEKIEAIYEEECWYCGSCMMDCKQDAIKVDFPKYMRPVVLKAGLKCGDKN